MVDSLVLLIIVVGVALAFDFINGMHDAANAIATSVSTRALSPRQAIILSATMNFIGAFLFTAVAKTIGKGIVDPVVITQVVVLSALLAAIFWNLLTWWWGLPSSSSHALIGGLIGAVVYGHGFGSLHSAGVLKIITGLVVSPLLGFGVGMLLMIAIYWAFHKTAPGRTNRYFSFGQKITAAFSALSHGSNDAQKSMGIITMALVAYMASQGSKMDFQVPMWVKFSCALAMALGTSAGGWRIIRTMGGKMIKLTPPNGFTADSTASIVIFGASSLGIPVSTTHVISSAILGVGAAKRFSSVRWGVAGRMVLAWIFTIPITGVLAAGFHWLLHFAVKG